MLRHLMSSLLDRLGLRELEDASFLFVGGVDDVLAGGGDLSVLDCGYCRWRHLGVLLLLGLHLLQLSGCIASLYISFLISPTYSSIISSIILATLRLIDHILVSF
jgi:hypothetical protein